MNHKFHIWVFLVISCRTFVSPLIRFSFCNKCVFNNKLPYLPGGAQRASSHGKTRVAAVQSTGRDQTSAGSDGKGVQVNACWTERNCGTDQWIVDRQFDTASSQEEGRHRTADCPCTLFVNFVTDVGVQYLVDICSLAFSSHSLFGHFTPIYSCSNH